MPSRHAIIKAIKENATIISCAVIMAGIIYGYGVIENKVENLTAISGNQTEAIKGLTKSMNCYITGGEPNQCIYSGQGLGVVDCKECNSLASK